VIVSSHLGFSLSGFLTGLMIQFSSFVMKRVYQKKMGANRYR